MIIKRFTKERIRKNEERGVFVTAGIVLTEDLSDSLSIEADRTISAVDDSLMIQRYVSSNNFV